MREKLHQQIFNLYNNLSKIFHIVKLLQYIYAQILKVANILHSK